MNPELEDLYQEIILGHNKRPHNKGELDPKKVLTPPVGPDGKAPATPAQPKGITPAQLGGWTVVSRVILNMDETITKE